MTVTSKCRCIIGGGSGQTSNLRERREAVAAAVNSGQQVTELRSKSIVVSWLAPSNDNSGEVSFQRLSSKYVCYYK